MAKAKRGVYWGRFNPPHNGHLKVIQHLLEKECEELVVAIGSCLSSHTERNPFSGGERLLMLKEMLAEEELLEKCLLVQVPDGESFASTASNLRIACPPFSVLYTNRAVIADIFSSWGVAVKTFPDFERALYQSTNARKALLEGKKVSHLVPPAVEKWLSQNNGFERLKICSSDKYE